jgi:hypothetical protein
MNCSLHRLDASHTATFAPALLALVGNIPEITKHLYQSFADRYPAIATTDSFRGLPSNTLAEVGVRVTLAGKVEFDITVDRIAARGVNLNRREDIAFAQDCLLIAHHAARKLGGDTANGTSNFRISSWLKLEGGAAAANELLSKSGAPAKRGDPSAFGAETLIYAPRIYLENKEEGWRLLLTAEPSAIADADLFLLRDFTFNSGGKMNSMEEQLAFTHKTSDPIFHWFGLTPPNAQG